MNWVRMPLSGVKLGILSSITLRVPKKSFGAIPRAKPSGCPLRIFLSPSGMIKSIIPRFPQDNATKRRKPRFGLTGRTTQRCYVKLSAHFLLRNPNKRLPAFMYVNARNILQHGLQSTPRIAALKLSEMYRLPACLPVMCAE